MHRLPRRPHMTLSRAVHTWSIQSRSRIGRMHNSPCGMRNDRCIGVCVLALLAVASVTLGQSASEWKKRIESAGAGQVIELPAGEISVGDVTIPAGVRLRGAGYNKTIINAGAFQT